ncbi:MAG TPA: DUF1328 domain-containing protein [Gemmatimonadales bacterium]|jgi:uncharacterized membrane protein YtjA (UPF0391 family)|nr:DUF1328 domain-containing protein [Gemmatimonadales bacterium]
MLRWAFAFFLLAFITALFAFGGVAAASVEIARVLFFVFLGVFLVTLVLGLAAGKNLASKV